MTSVFDIDHSHLRLQFAEISISDENIDDPIDDFDERDDATTDAQSKQPSNVRHEISLSDSARLFIF